MLNFIRSLLSRITAKFRGEEEHKVTAAEIAGRIIDAINGKAVGLDMAVRDIVLSRIQKPSPKIVYGGRAKIWHDGKWY